MDDEQSVVESLLEMHQSVRRWNPSVLAVDDNAEANAQKAGACETVVSAAVAVPYRVMRARRRATCSLGASGVALPHASLPATAKLNTTGGLLCNQQPDLRVAAPVLLCLLPGHCLCCGCSWCW